MYDDLYISVKMSFKIMITYLINRRGVIRLIRRIMMEVKLNAKNVTIHVAHYYASE